jgi:hypothetical protein
MVTELPLFLLMRRKKTKNLMKIVGEKAQNGNFLILPHAASRRLQRKISVSDIVYVLKNGWHESKKDEFKNEYNEWNYALKGKTIDKRTLRIVISFDINMMLIVTVIDLRR